MCFLFMNFRDEGTVVNVDYHFVLYDSFNRLNLIKNDTFNRDLVQIVHANIVDQGL